MDRSEQRNRHLAFPIALLCACGVGIPLLVTPPFVPLGIGICLASAALSLVLYAEDLLRIPLWCLRKRIPVTRVSTHEWIATWIILSVVILGLGAPLYWYKYKLIEIPSVLLLWENNEIRMYNRSSENIAFYGDKFDDLQASTMDAPRIIPAAIGTSIPFYFLPWPNPNEYAKQHIGDNGEQMIPFEAYIQDENKIKYTAKFYILMIMQNSVMTIRTQQLGVTKGGW
jgi:hypothetical protein